MSDELADMLGKPTAPPTKRSSPAKDFTRQINVQRDSVEAEIRAEVGLVNEGTGLEYLEEEGLNPDEWEATHFRKIKYGEGYESVKFSYKRKALLDAERPNIDELVRIIKRQRPKVDRPTGDHGFIVALGDMQFGKVDGDGVEGTLKRTIDCINRAADLLVTYRQRFDIGHVHIAWLGDHVEGFVSQGGANAWRTQLTLTEQIRLTRRVMLHALVTFAPLAERVTMAAVPGNHGETIRFAGKGVTRYDDSHDTESLVAVSDAAELNPEAFGHVEFYVPETDELVVVLDVAGTVVAHAHGHFWRVGKHFDWWKGQAFTPSSAMYEADLLLAGHLHHEFVEADGPRLFIQVPAMESESTWFRHSRGTTGSPGLVVAVTKDGRTDQREVVRSD